MTTTTEVEEENAVKEIMQTIAKAMVRVHFPETDQHGNPSLGRFLLENGRLPFVDDQIKPWFYRGWLIPYIQGAEKHRAVSPRYDYVMRTLEAGKLLDEPIPEIEFCGEFEPATKPGVKMLQKCLDEVEYRSGSWNGMREFCEWLAFALGVTHEPSKLNDSVQEFLYRNFDLEPILLHPADYLGNMLCETSHGKKNGFYPTPFHLVDMMTRITFGARHGDQKTVTFSDPAGCGTGRMLLAASNYTLRLYGVDIDYLCVLITKINLALYAPWHYIPEEFFPAKAEKPEKAAEAPPLTVEAEKIEPEPPNAKTTMFEAMRLEKESKKRKVYTTKIDEQFELF